MSGRPWTREELILTLSIYFQLPFGRLNRNTKEVKELAKIIGRSYNSAALRLVNFAACDPYIINSGRTGMPAGRYKVKNIENIYGIKFKSLLVNVALGMTPAKEWDGKFEANGGYLVVKNDGDIVCYHFYDRNQLEDYLVKNTTFDNPSRSRYHYGAIYRGKDGKAYLKLCLQIRFK